MEALRVQAQGLLANPDARCVQYALVYFTGAPIYVFDILDDFLRDRKLTRAEFYMDIERRLVDASLAAGEDRDDFRFLFNPRAAQTICVCGIEFPRGHFARKGINILVAYAASKPA